MKALRLSVLAGLLIAAAASADARSFEIPAGTVVPVQTTAAISGNSVASGQTVGSVVVAQDVVKDGVTVIKGGTPVFATVADAEESGYVGQAGKLVINLQSTTAVDGTNVPLSGTMMVKEDSEVGVTAAASVILCPLFALNKGDEAVIPAGYQARAMTVGSVRINIH
ncbi:MAG: hypothetical protein D6794_12450 [Deltaproteobacteria bacterium]|nr:MAG: hypothetical protein D6794_12450 [Deltaproteobacteria bacterium]